MQEQQKHTRWEDLISDQRDTKKYESLDKEILQIISEKLKFEKVTKVQAAVIPLFLSNKDVCVKACTGSGKTLSFIVPLVQRISKMVQLKISQLKINQVENQEESLGQVFRKEDVLGLVIAPSRELVIQIFQELKHFESIFQQKKDDGSIENIINCCYFIGGDKPEYDKQRIEQKGANIIVATPGRLFDLIESNQLNFRFLEILIMDEADKILDQGGNEVKIQYILNHLPKQRRTGLFSATMPTQLKNLIKSGMRNPFFIEVKTDQGGIFAYANQNKNSVSIQQFDQMNQDEKEEQIKNISEIPSNLQNYYQLVENQFEKLPALIDFLENHVESSRIIIFFSTCASVNFYFLALQILAQKYMKKSDAQLYKLHGKIDQKKRTKIYKEFKELKLDREQEKKNHFILLTTDLSSRGIDIPEVDWIIQFDPPQWIDSFVHRIGRTARAGRQGQSIIFLNKNEFPYINFLIDKKVVINELQPEKEDGFLKEPSKEIRDLIQKEMQEDKDLVNKSQDGFVSFVRYYKEHQLNFIFSFTLLELGQVANAFFLFKIPRIKEILGKPLRNFTTQNIDLDSIPYKDQNKCKQKQEVTQKRKEKFDLKMKQKEEEKQILIKDRDGKLKQKMEKKKRFEKTRTCKKLKKQEADWNEWKDLQKEENLYKKLKKGKITKEQYEKLLDEQSLSEDE